MAGGRHSGGGALERKALLIAGAALAVILILVTNSLAGHLKSPASRSSKSPASRSSKSPASRSSAQHTTVPLKPRSATPEPARAHGNPLGAAAASYLATRSGVASAAVYDLDTGRSWTIGDSHPQAEASIVKLDILETLLAQRDRGLSGSDRALARRMIEDSDNDAATTLWRAVGGAQGIRAFNADAGLTATSPSRCVVCPGFPWPGWGLTKTVAADQITLLRQAVQPGSLLTGAERGYVLRLMKNVAPGQRWGVSGGVPATVTVALKNGWLPLNQAGTNWQINSIGWISGLGRDYLMAVLTTGNPSEAYGIDTIDALAAVVWKGMG
jgi:hypothetical protein